MANEFKIKNGLIVQGAMSASFSYTTSSWSQNALTSSLATTASAAVTVLGTVATASYALTASVLLGSVTSASYALSSSNALLATSALTATTAITASNAITASHLLGLNLVATGSIISALNTASAVISINTGSYLAAFFDYVAVSESNSRCGKVFGSWVNGTLNYTEVSNVDIGNTSQVTMSMGLNGAIVQLSASVSNTSPWTIKATARYI